MLRKNEAYLDASRGHAAHDNRKVLPALRGIREDLNGMDLNRVVIVACTYGGLSQSIQQWYDANGRKRVPHDFQSHSGDATKGACPPTVAVAAVTDTATTGARMYSSLIDRSMRRFVDFVERGERA